MYQRGCLQRLPGLFLSEFLSSHLTQFIVHQRQKLLRGVRVAVLDGVQDARHFTHRRYRKAHPSLREVQDPEGEEKR